MSLKFIDIIEPAMSTKDRKQAERVTHFTISDRIAPYGVLRVGGGLEHGACIRPRTRDDRDALVLFLMSIEYDDGQV